MGVQIMVAKEVADLLRIDRQRVYELVRTKRLPVIRLGERQYRFSRQAIEGWVKNGGNLSTSRRVAKQS